MSRQLDLDPGSLDPCNEVFDQIVEFEMISSKREKQKLQSVFLTGRRNSVRIFENSSVSNQMKLNVRSSRSRCGSIEGNPL